MAQETELPCGLVGSAPPSFLEWYLYAAGESKIPYPFHLWAGLQLVAACVQNRVWYEKFRGSRLYPNLYVMLIGPSGTGKGQAIKTAQKLVEGFSPEDQKLVQFYRGKTTPQALITRMGQKEYGNFIWLLTPELSMAVGSGTKADDFVKHMTELYEGDYTFTDSTRMYGTATVHDPCINWTSGTTREWLLDSVGKQDILSGFFARVCAVPASRRLERFPEPVYPPDHDVVQDWLRQYALALTRVGGPIRMDDAARMIHRDWYMSRPEPKDELLWPFYERSDDMVLKLSCLLALADQFGRVIRPKHLQNAIRLADWIMGQLPLLLEYAHRTPDMEMLAFLANWFEARTGQWIQHSVALKAATNRGANAERFKQLMQTLVERGDIVVGQARGGKRYKWRIADGEPDPT